MYKSLTILIALLACVAAWLAVPEFRKMVGLDQETSITNDFLDIADGGDPGLPGMNEDADDFSPTLLAASHIIISYKNAVNAPESLTRTRAQAYEKAKHIADLIQLDPEQFNFFARTESDGPFFRSFGLFGCFLSKELW